MEKEPDKTPEAKAREDARKRRTGMKDTFGRDLPALREKFPG
ncbi:hypothetical protein ACWPM1_13080 [Tsuneonella sp. HG249]